MPLGHKDEKETGDSGTDRMEQIKGLTEKEAGRLLARNGKNILKRPKGKSGFLIFVQQLNDPLIYVLLAAAFVSVLLKEYSDALIIAVVVVLNAFVGAIQEGKAKRALEALQELQSPVALVIRDGEKRRIAAERLVMGDLVCLEAGCRVPADIRLTEAIDLQTEESALTGESMPVAKKTGDPVYLSTIVTAGRGRGIVTATGMSTELGKIADMIHQGREELTPLQKRLGELGTILSLLSLLLCGILFGIAVLQKREVMQMLLTAISLAVAAVPEGLPAVVTICLALSVGRMVKAGTIVRRLPAIETLGAVSVVCSDKTGTLTQNRMTVEQAFWDGAVHNVTEGTMMPPENFLRALVLCNDADLGTEKSRKRRQNRERKRLGDPTELGLLEFGRQWGMEKETLEEYLPRVDEQPFTSESKLMCTYHRSGNALVGYCKGAADEVMKKCRYMELGGRMQPLTKRETAQVRQSVSDLASRAYRTLALAMRRGGKDGPGEKAGEWIFLGLVAMRDPLRPQVFEAVQTLKQAGVQTVMITGDHVKTAMAVGRKLGIAEQEEQCITGEMMETIDDGNLAAEIGRRDLRVFARVSPAQKVRIVKAFQGEGRIIAMTGDGVNDAPSLRAADIGIAMGRNGTDVARQAADMVLTDDHFATIEKAIAEGRGVYENIRKSVIFLLSSNLGEILTMFVSVCLGLAAPLKSVHILWINLITDSLPALALGVDRNDKRELMKNPPRKVKESLFARGGLGCTCFYGILIAGISLTAFCMPMMNCLREAAGWREKIDACREALSDPAVLLLSQTYAFTVLGMSQLFHAIGMRDVGRSIFRMKHLENPLMLLALGMGFMLQFAVTEVPFLIRAFKTAPLSAGQWCMLTGFACAPLLAHELMVLFAAGE